MRALLLLLATAACRGPEPLPQEGLTGDGLLWPFPSAHLMQDGHVSVPANLLPQVDPASGGTALPVDRLNWRTGFSPTQPIVALLPGIDADVLPGWTNAKGGGTVRLIDLDGRRELPCFAELDAHPDAVHHPERQALIIRPMIALPYGHRIAVVITTDAMAPNDRYRALTSGDEPPGLEGWSPHYVDLANELASLGLDESEVALAWDFPVGDGTARMRYLAANTVTPHRWEVLGLEESDGGDPLPPGTWRQITARFEVTNWLVDDLAFDINDNWPAEQGEAWADLFIHIPESVRSAPRGSVPVVIFGHGLLTDPQHFLEDEQDSESFVDLFNRMGVIVVGTTWRGLTYKDLADTVWVANDFGRFNQLTERLCQGVANTIALMRFVEDGDLMDDPLFAGLADTETVYYYGVSAGSLLGGATLAYVGPHISYSVLHVGGSSWATTLERSANWTDFEPMVEDGIPDPADRQLLYAVSQLMWDAVDPVSYADELSQLPIILQEARGDDEVPNFGTELLARSASWPVLTPIDQAPDGLRTVSAPARAPVLVQFDPELPFPADNNQPAERTGAHRIPRHWEQTKEQTLRFLDPDTPGVVEHYCGTHPCTASNADGD